MPVSPTTPGCPDARAVASVHVAFRLRNSVGAQDVNLCEAQWLAYASPYRRFAVALADDRARLRVDADRYSLIVSDLHQLHLNPGGKEIASWIAEAHRVNSQHGEAVIFEQSTLGELAGLAPIEEY